MSQIIVFPRGQLAAKDKERLTKAGIVAVEADDPSKVVCVVPGAPMASTNDLLMAALDAVVCDFASGGVSTTFAKGLHRRLKAKEVKAASEAG